MTSFWIICSAMLVIALLFVVFPLWRSSVKNNGVVRDETNLAILRHQTTELETDFNNGLLTQEALEQGKQEIQARLLDEVNVEQPNKLLANPAKILGVVLIILVPLASFLTYHQFGSKEGLAYQPPERNDEQEAPQQKVMTTEDIKKLEQSLQSNPNNPEGWWDLANVYTEQNRFIEATAAYAKLVELIPSEAQLWANYADVYVMANNRTFDDQSLELIKKALMLEPSNLTALALNANAAMQREDYVTAVKSWQFVSQLLPPDSQYAQMALQGMEQAHQLLMQGQGGANGEQLDTLAGQAAMAEAQQAAGADFVTGKVSLSPDLASKVSPEDTVFILAKSAGGGRTPPLAVIRKQVKDLPMEFRLDDSMAMQPAFRLSAFGEIQVVARVSKSGTAMPQPGDLQGSTEVIKPGAEGLNVVIDKITE